MPASLETGAAVRAERVSDAAALHALRPEWEALWRRSPTATPFGHPAWLEPWWRCFGDQPGWALWTVALRAEGRLVGLAPLVRHPGPRGERQLSLLGIGISDYGEVLLEPGWETQAVRSFWEHLAGHRDGWDRCDLEQLRADSPLPGISLPPPLVGETVPQAVCPAVSLPDTPEALLAGLPAWLRRNLRRGRRRLAERGDLRFTTADAETLPEHLDAFVRLHEARARDAERSGLTDGEAATRRFLRLAAGELLRAGLLQMHGVRLRGELVAVLYAMGDGSRVYAYQSGFDPALGRDSPGSLVVAHAMGEAIRAGAREWDWLRGAEDYKYPWGAEDRQTFWLQVGHAGEDMT